MRCAACAGIACACAARSCHGRRCGRRSEAERMRFGVVYSIEGGGGDRADQVFREAIEEITLAETIGIDSAFLSEHHSGENDFFPSPRIALTFLAARTPPNKIGPGVLLLPLYDPIHVAEDCAVLD